LHFSVPTTCEIPERLLAEETGTTLKVAAREYLTFALNDQMLRLRRGAPQQVDEELQLKTAAA